MLYMLALRVSDKFLLLTYNLQNLVFVSPNDLFSSALRNSIPFNHDRSCKHEQPKEGGKGPLDCEYFRKKVVFFVSSGKTHHFWPPLENSLASLEKTSVARPG